MERTIPQNTKSHDYSTLSESFSSNSEVFDDDVVEVDEVEVDEKDLENELHEKTQRRKSTWDDRFERVSNYILCCIVGIFIDNVVFYSQIFIITYQFLYFSGRNWTKIRNMQKNGTLATSAHPRKKMKLISFHQVTQVHLHFDYLTHCF